MFFLNLAVFHILTVTLLAAAGCISSEQASPTPKCAPVHIIAVRGTFMPPGAGIVGCSLAPLVMQNYPSSTLEAVDYPAEMSSSDDLFTCETYMSSVEQGITAFTEQLTSYVSHCPNSQIVLMGASQGAHVIMNALCGSGDQECVDTGPATINQTIGNNIEAIVAFGDPGHRAGKPYNLGTAPMKNGSYPRPYHACDTYKHRIASYCDLGDPACTGSSWGFRGLLAHLQYFSKYNEDAAQFILSRLGR